MQQAYVPGLAERGSVHPLALRADEHERRSRAREEGSVGYAAHLHGDDAGGHDHLELLAGRQLDDVDELGLNTERAPEEQRGGRRVGPPPRDEGAVLLLGRHEEDHAVPGDGREGRRGAAEDVGEHEIAEGAHGGADTALQRYLREVSRADDDVLKAEVAVAQVVSLDQGPARGEEGGPLADHGPAQTIKWTTIQKKPRKNKRD